MKQTYTTIKNNLKKFGKNVLLVYVIGGSAIGLGDYMIGGTTGHLSSDIYLGKKTPTKFERMYLKKIFGIEENVWETYLTNAKRRRDK